ncbi:MAG: CAP domain-containing protein [Pseudomonadota bacterium]
MFRFFFVSLIAFAGSFVAQACNMSTDARSADFTPYYQNGVACLDAPPNGLRFDQDIEARFLDQINTERRAAGLTALRLRTDLRPAARFHSLDMAVNAFFNHESPNGRKAGERIAAFDRTLLAKSTAENIAQYGPVYCTDHTGSRVSCFESPDFELPTPTFVARDLHTKLMASEWHRANILNGRTTHVAIGVARSDTGFYVTQVFAQKLGELNAPLPIEIGLNSRVQTKAEIEDWSFGSFGIVTPGEGRVDLKGSRMIGVSLGDKKLIVRGEKVSKEHEINRIVTTTQWLDLFGPAFSVVRATES